MKILINLKFVAVILATIMASSTFVACSGSDDDGQDEWNSSNDNDDDSSSDPTYQLVKKNISASVSYGDYSWNISIKSKLASSFPESQLSMGLKVATEITNTMNILSSAILIFKRTTEMEI